MNPAIDIATDPLTNNLTYRLTMPVCATLTVKPRTIPEEHIHAQLARTIASRLSAHGLKDTIVALCYAHAPGVDLARTVSEIVDRAYTKAYDDAMNSVLSRAPVSQPTATLRF